VSKLGNPRSNNPRNTCKAIITKKTFDTYVTARDEFLATQMQ